MSRNINDHYEAEPHDHSEPHAVHHVPYMAIFGALVVLTIITVLIGIYLRFSNELVNVLLALLVAAIKGTLVARFFMHLKFEGKLVRMIFVVPLLLCVLLVVALLPDILPLGDASLKMFNVPPMMHDQHEHGHAH